MSPTTNHRRQAIRSILAETQVRSQAELLDLLAEEGHQATQPALSRDLRALNVAKRGGIYHLIEQERVTPLAHLQSLLRGATHAGRNLLVVRCEPGAASAVARALEAEALDGLVGTVAGDDTVFAAVTDRGAGTKIRERVLSLLS